MAQRALTVLSGLAKGKVFPLSGERLRVGRDDSCNIVFDDNDVSREHALLTLAGEDYRVKDLQSRNGTRVNGLKIQEKLLAPGDRVQFGLVETRYEATQPAVQKPAPAVQVVAPPVRIPPAKPVASPAPKPITPSANEQSLRADELTKQNQQLTAQVTELRQQLQQAQKPPADLARLNAELTAAQRELATAKEQAAVQVAAVRQASQKELAALRADLTTHQAELAKAREQAGRVAELSRQNQELNAQLTAAQTKWQAELEERKTDRARLEDAERKNRELTGLVAGTQGREKAIIERAQTEQSRLVKQLGDVKTELEDVRRRLAQSEQLQQQNQILATQLAASRVDLSAARQQLAERPVITPPSKPVVDRPVVVKPIPPPPAAPVPNVIAGERAAEYSRVQSALHDAQAQLGKVATAAGRQDLEERLATVQARLAETETADDKRALGALRRLREDLAEIRTVLLGMLENVPTLPSNAPAASRQKGRWWALLGAGAVVVVAVVLVVWQSVHGTPASQVKPTTATTASVTAPPVAEPPLATYTDPKGRFTCQVPQGWTVQEIPDESRSRAKFVSGNDEIRVNSYGADWPPLQRDDRDMKEAAEAISSLLKLDNQAAGTYAEVLGGGWRAVEGVPAFQSDMTLAADTANWRLRVVYYRKLGREHVIALYVRSLDEESYLKLVLDEFLAGFHSVGANKAATQLATSP